MKISLESSERIRKQQKELIDMLQRSQSLTEMSVASFNSYSSSLRGGGRGDDDESTIASYSVVNGISNKYASSSNSLQEENKSWLNSSPHHRQGPEVQHQVLAASRRIGAGSTSAPQVTNSSLHFMKERKERNKERKKQRKVFVDLIMHIRQLVIILTVHN
jgi:hypothetical protein